VDTCRKQLLSNPLLRIGRPADLIELAPQRIINDDSPAIGEGFDRMTHITRYDRDQPGSCDLRCAVNGHLQLAFDYLVDLFLSMEMFVNGRASLEVVMRNVMFDEWK
jgi:hypothetical protein